VYLAEGGTTSLNLPEGTYTVRWYNPREGGELRTGDTQTVPGGKPAAIGNPPADRNKDWAAVIIRK
jgi:hypothetical protein